MNDQIYILVKAYSDNSGYAIVGATTNKAVAQAFDAGGVDGSAVSIVYLVTVDAPVRDTMTRIIPYSFAEAK